jgi:hypothetical protein
MVSTFFFFLVQIPHPARLFETPSLDTPFCFLLLRSGKGRASGRNSSCSKEVPKFLSEAGAETKDVDVERGSIT